MEPKPKNELLKLIEWCCGVAQEHVKNGNYGWAEFTLARAQEAANVYATLTRATRA